MAEREGTLALTKERDRARQRERGPREGGPPSPLAVWKKRNSPLILTSVEDHLNNKTSIGGGIREAIKRNNYNSQQSKLRKDHWPHSGLLARLLDDIRVVRNGSRRPVCTVQVIIAESRLMLHSTESENFILS